MNSKKPPGVGARRPSREVANAPLIRYRWAQKGDVNAFFGLMLDNLAGLILMVSLLSVVFGMEADFVVQAMVPGTALGVLIGDLAFFVLAFRLAKRHERTDVTAMPLGLDTPSIFGMILFVVGPAFIEGQRLGLETAAAHVYAWHIGIGCVVVSGLFKLACAPFSGWVRQLVPRASLLGSLAAIALVLISFLPLLDILGHPLPGLVALAIVLTALIGRVPLPFHMPGTLGALLVAGAIYFLMVGLEMPGYGGGQEVMATVLLPSRWLEAWSFGWLSHLDDAIRYLPVALPFALGTVVGGIDCTESAAAAGDEYDTKRVIGVEAIATLIAGLSGGVIQTTPYIGHPAYKAMGGRAAYTLGTALLIGSAGMIGYFGYLYAWIPAPAVYPILVFIGLEIAAQSFSATPKKHYPAVAIACLPALAFLMYSMADQLLSEPAVREAGVTATNLLSDRTQAKLAVLIMLSNGFIVTSLLWAWAVVAMIDRHLRTAAVVFAVAGILTLFGVIHSPGATNRIFLPFGPDSIGGLSLTNFVLSPEQRPAVLEFASGYFASAILLALWSLRSKPSSVATETP